MVGYVKLKPVTKFCKRINNCCKMTGAIGGEMDFAAMIISAEWRITLFLRAEIPYISKPAAVERSAAFPVRDHQTDVLRKQRR